MSEVDSDEVMSRPEDELDIKGNIDKVEYPKKNSTHYHKCLQRQFK